MDFDNYAEMTHRSSSRLLQLSHERRFALSQRLTAAPEGGTILDYGCADGAFSVRLSNARPDLTQLMWNPFPEDRDELRRRLSHPRLEVVDDIDALPPACVDVVLVQEVFEHLGWNVVEKELTRIASILRPDGRLVVTVPIEIGPSAIAKNALRAALGRAHPSTTTGAVAAAAIGRPHPRPEQDYYYSHVGFDHRVLARRLVERGWAIRTTAYSPVRWLRSVGNSQVGWVLELTDRADEHAFVSPPEVQQALQIRESVAEPLTQGSLRAQTQRRFF